MIEPPPLFRREFTPAWLATASVLAGQRPPDLTRPFRYVHLGCGRGVTSAVVASVHPQAEVWAWDWRPAQVEATRRRRDAAGLSNMVVHERPGLPPDFGSDRLADIVIVADVFVAASDDMRDQILDAVATNLRPGGLVCVAYKTMAGWTEIVPIQRLMRYVAQRFTGHPQALVPHVLALLQQLRDGGAKHLTERPVVSAWLDELLVTDADTITAEYLHDDFRPLSHAQVASAMTQTGCDFIGSARLTDELDLDVPSALADMVATAGSRVLKDTYRDLAVRRTERHDLFRLGQAPLTTTERFDALAALQILDPAGPPEARTTAHDVALRNLLDSGDVQPVAPGGVHIVADLLARLGVA